MIKICAVGGYNEIGKNMTAVKVDDEAVIIDMGLHLDNYIRYTDEEEENMVQLSADELSKAGAIPNDKVIKDWRDKVKAIIPTHAHLDHVGALIFLANKYNAPILCTPFTAEVIKTISRDEGIKLRNPACSEEMDNLSSEHVKFWEQIHPNLQLFCIKSSSKW